MSISKILRHFVGNCRAVAPRLDAGIGAIAARIVVACTSAVLATAAMAGDYDKDQPGATDHPSISRFKGATLYRHGAESLAKADFLVADKGKPVLQSFEGRVSSLMYIAPAGVSALEVYRGYQKALSAAGFQVLFACEVGSCEKSNVQNIVKEFPRQSAWIQEDPMVRGIFDSGNRPGFHYLSARKMTPAGAVYVQLGLARGSSDPPNSGRVWQFLQVLEPAKLESGKVTIGAQAIRESLGREGKIALYGIYFDTNKAVVREESADQLAELAQLLKSSSALKAYVVGHTDNQGEYDANLLLSQKRAQAVIDALAGRYGIAASRLRAHGVADISPVASNTSDEGRARNRRVEFVAR